MVWASTTHAFEEDVDPVTAETKPACIPASPSDATRALADHVEWPTIGVAVFVYGMFGLVTWFHDALPWWLLVPVGGYLVALHGSLQHEVVHGHPTPWRWLNETLVFPSLWLWLPYGLYRQSHLLHHCDKTLTDPVEDPESFYLTADAWARLPAPARWILTANNSALGRLLFGPPLVIARFLHAELTDTFWTRDRATAWLLHVGGAAAVAVWVSVVCGMPLAEYVLAVAYPGIALTLLRSFAEHRADPDPARRTAIVEAEAPLALLFLNNNLHVVHHAHPGAAWYRLPQLYRRRDFATAGETYDGYRSVIFRHFLRPRQPVVHPLHAA